MECLDAKHEAFASGESSADVEVLDDVGPSERARRGWQIDQKCQDADPDFRDQQAIEGGRHA
jgi:hypothetical protein